MLTFQLLSKDGSSLDDAEVLSGRWQAYVEGFVSETETPGVPAAKVRQPFLRRCVCLSSPPLPSPPLTGVDACLQIDAKGTESGR
jgi:paired amphipathic helix protein Sin3a